MPFFPYSRFAVLIVVSVFAPASAMAQAELDGTFIDYLGFGSGGVMVNSAQHSQRYSESGMAPYSCDAFAIGTPIETFGIEATGMSFVSGQNKVDSAQIATTSGPSEVGSTIVWTGEYANGPDQFAFTQVASLSPGDRHVQMTVTIENTGSQAVTDLYYFRSMDPDHGRCGIGNDSFLTENDVLRQPPTDNAALIVARARGIPNDVILGVGAFDSRARAHSDSGINTTPSSTWLSANDPNGAYSDQAISLAFYVPMIPAGDSVTFDMIYVWGQTDAVVEERFDALRCAVLGDGATCSEAGDPGTCRAGACCTGCWDGATCQPGQQIDECGQGGDFCATCVDGNPCTQDQCTSTGICQNPPEGAGTACDDSLFCTAVDTCDGAGACMGAGLPCDDGLSCTTESCNEGTNSCTSSLDSGFCLVDSTCTADGMASPTNSCEICDANVSTSTYAFAMAGTACQDGNACTSGDSCNGTGACDPGMSICMDGAVPDGAVPDGAVPDGAVPDGALPDSALPDSAVPDGALPDSAVPDGAVPDGAVPDGAVPDGAVPDGALPDGAVGDASADAADDDFGYSGGACKCGARRTPTRPIDFFGVGLVLLALARRRRREERNGWAR